MNAKKALLSASLLSFALGAPALRAGSPCSPCAPRPRSTHKAQKANPCAAKGHRSTKDPCSAKNPCAGMNPCAAGNPCAAKNPCGARNPCAAR